MSVAGSAVLHHTCFVVNDVERTARSLFDSMGIGPWGILTIEPTEATIHGKAAQFSFRIALAQVGGGAYELLAPLDGESLYTEFLQRHGEGFHHTCLAYPTREAMRQAKSELLAQGRELVQDGVIGDVAEFSYFLVPEVGSVIELLHIAEMPEPEMTIG